MSNWQSCPPRARHAVHPGIFRLHWSVEKPAPIRSWDIIEQRQVCESPLTWDGTRLTHPELGCLLTLCAEPDWREACLQELPDLKARPGDELPAGRARQMVRLRWKREPGWLAFGLGQRITGARRDPGVYSNWTVDPPAGHHKRLGSLYQAHPYLLLARPGVCLGLVLNSTWYSRFDLGEGHEEEWSVSALGGEAECFVLAGKTPAEVCRLLADLTGHPARPPRWALGFHQSRWGYREGSEIAELVEQFRQRRIPLDVVHLDIDYMDNYRSFSFHPERFPDPAGLAARVGQQGVRLVSIIDPGVRCEFHGSYDVARQGAEAGHFLRNPDGSPFTGYCWPDAALFTDYCRSQARVWWGSLGRRLLDNGVSGIWIDMNEPAVFARPFSEGHSPQLPLPLALEQGDDEERTVHAETHNLYGHLMARATWEGLRRLRPEEEPWVLTRSAFLGTQKYAFAWMGDNSSWWEHLALSLPQLVSMGLSGAPFVGVDIGGFFGNCHAELFVRWMELGAFYPFMRNHSAVGTRPQEPWAFGAEAEELVRRQIELRYRLLPYFNALADHAHETGEPWLRALFHEFPDDAESYLHDDQAMVGEWLLIAPVCRPGHRQRQVYFPPGIWFDFWSERHVEGPSFQSWPAPLGQMPLFLRQGACLPISAPRMSTEEAPQQPAWILCPAERPTSGCWVGPGDECSFVQLRASEARLSGPLRPSVSVWLPGKRFQFAADPAQGQIEWPPAGTPE